MLGINELFVFWILEILTKVDVISYFLLGCLSS